MVYPDARIEETEDILAGISFSDPYRWLEQDSDEVRRWQRVQADLASAHVREWPLFDRLQEAVTRFNTERFVPLPRYAGGRWFRMEMPEGACQAQVMVSREPMGSGRVLFDPMIENPRQPPFVSWISPSPDGCTLAVGVCVDGSETNTIRLSDVATGQVLADPPPHRLMDNWTGGVAWLPDSSGFFFSAITGAAVEFDQRVYLYTRTPVPRIMPVDVPWTGGQDYRAVVVSPDGRYAVALERLTTTIPVALATLGEARLRWRPFVTTAAGLVAGHVVGQRYVAVTDVGAPRGRLVAIPLDDEEPNNPEHWEELVAESEAVLRTVTPVGKTLYLTELLDTYSRVRIVGSNGRDLGAVSLPGQGAVMEGLFPLMNLAQRAHPEKFVFAFSSLTVSPGIYSHTPGHTELVTLKQPRVRLEGAIVEDRWATSADGAHIPYHVVRRADVDATRPRPTLIYAYGGFNVPCFPQFPGPMAAFVAAGGVLVHAHLRGGGEFGLEWWEGGRRRNKQNCYQDLYAVAEDLIAAARCTAAMLAVTGGSNGGLMAAVALTQRPELWAVVVPRVPILDLIGACRDGYARKFIRMEYADVENPDEVRRLATFSPYHLVCDGVRYPAVFIDAGNTDPRCPPWHARKFAARLQKATARSAPILLHVWESAGHGHATDRRITAAQNTEWLAFALRHLGVNDWPDEHSTVRLRRLAARKNRETDARTPRGSPCASHGDF
jgi:prolyl oligopeptidase